MKPRTKTGKDPPQDDPRIQQLMEDYVRLSEQVAALTELLRQQSDAPPALPPAKTAAPPPEKPAAERTMDGLTVDEILAEVHQRPTAAAPPPTVSPPTARRAAASRAAPRRAATRQPAPPQATQQQQPPPQAAPPPPREPSPRPAKKGRAWGIIGNILFYGILLAMLVGVFALRAGSNGAPVSFAGFTAQIVLTGSMEDVIPKGALVVSKQVDPATLEIGDDITYLASQTATVTHRIIGITENYEGTGRRAFQTQGVMNDSPDKDPVPAANVVGKVVFHSKMLGQGADFLSKNWPIVLFLAALLIVFIMVLQRILRSTPEDGSAETAQAKQKKRKSHQV